MAACSLLASAIAPIRLGAEWRATMFAKARECVSPISINPPSAWYCLNCKALVVESLLSLIEFCGVLTFMDSTSNLLPATKSQLAGDLVHLRKLWIGLRRTSMVVQQAMIAYGDSRRLLERIDGAPSARVLSEIRISE